MADADPSEPRRFVVLDGGEGCGKSTQIQLLEAAYAEANLRPLVVRDPGTTRVGELIRAILLNPDHTEMSMRCEMLLYMAARAQMAAETIRPTLAAGRALLCDRFVSSTLSYQLGGDGLTAAEITDTLAVALGSCPHPDVTVILDMPVERSIARVGSKRDRIEQRPIAYHEQVRQNYLDQAARDPARYAVVDADRPVRDVHADILAACRLRDAPLFQEVGA